jgi:galactokinase/mevalonate kinase-like predicted kinase
MAFIFAKQYSQLPFKSILPREKRHAKYYVSVLTKVRVAPDRIVEAHYMGPNTEKMDEKKIAYEASKRYVVDKYPEFGEIFDEMWNLSVSNSKKQPASSPDLKKDVGGLNFVLDNSVGQIITIALPFISGVVSSILSHIILQKTGLKSKETAKIAEDKAERIRISLNVSKETADELLPYILSGIAKVSADVKKSKQ